MEYNKKYHNCLRIQIANDDCLDERIDDLTKHCVKYGFDNVMLMINTEEFNIGHITLDEAKPWVAALKKVKESLEQSGISVSLNNWIELGHADRARTLKAGQNFVNMTDMDGNTATLITCPLDTEWRKYFMEYAKYLTKELQPDTFWIEDDFRLHNHTPLHGIGCYCEKHMAYFNDKLKTNYTREEFVKRIFAKGPCNVERKVWLDSNRDVMIELAAEIRDAVKSVKPDTDLAIMSSSPEAHCIEGRDWEKFFIALNGEYGNKINRIHLKYGEDSGKAYIYYFNAVSMAVRAMTNDDVIVMPELEHGSANLYSRGARYLKFVLQASTPLILSGMTYSLYGFDGSGVRDSFGYGQVIKDLQPFMQKVLDLNLKFSSMCGVVVPLDPNASYYREIRNSYTDLEPREYHAAAYISGCGVSYRYSREKTFENETVFLTGSSAVCFTDEQLRELFENNFVIVDAGAVIELKKRDFLKLICAKAIEIVPSDTGYQSYEECNDERLLINGTRKLHASCRGGASGEFLKIEYECDKVNIKTKAFNHYMEPLAPAIVGGKNFLVIPYFVNDKRFSLFCDLRSYFIIETVTTHTHKYAVCDYPGISPYLYSQQNCNVIMVSNGQFDNFSSIKMQIDGFDFNKIFRIGDDGELYNVEYTRNGTHLEIKTPLEYLTTAVLIFE